ncbi:hypothetical protein [Ahrensia sp. R2A130]|uniref:hypothetical protein n=1 Tax=Ahrensia sp. R2A130 TaxID=744979 RepID=UPI0001E0ACB3|nr:hypothetical protein [Ahrensia sp. R2A130]EFL88674.1 hypothetical protein R2A130_1157 [Ahrensia sp. R2A130]
MILANFDDLRYSSHFEHYDRMGVFGGNVESDKYFRQQAHEMHYLNVVDPLMNLQFPILDLQYEINDEKAKNHLLYGAVKRSRIIWSAYREFYSIAPPNRTAPLTGEEPFDVDRALNDIYIQSRGLLDNFAWGMLYALHPEKVDSTHPNDIGIFSKKFAKLPKLSWLNEVVPEFKNWEKGLKLRRDSGAHRIPLSVPPSVVDEDGAKARSILLTDWQKASADHIAALSQKHPEEEIEKLEKIAESFKSRLDNLGSFQCLMVQDANSQPVPIYPTVTEDVGYLVQLVSILVERLKNTLDQAASKV